MALLCDYFGATSDEAAAATIDWVGGPSQPPPGSSTTPLMTVAMPGVEPTVMMGTLESLLTGRPWEEILADPSRQEIAERDEGERVIVPLGRQMDAVMAGVSDERLREVATEWSQTEEFQGQGDPQELGNELVRLAGLARETVPAGGRLYCWVSV